MGHGPRPHSLWWGVRPAGAWGDNGGGVPGKGTKSKHRTAKKKCEKVICFCAVKNHFFPLCGIKEIFLMAPLALTVRHFLGSAREKNFLTSAVPFFSGYPRRGGDTKKKFFWEFFFEWPPGQHPCQALVFLRV